MNRPDLADTLIDLVRGVTPPAGSGLVVTSATLDVPLELGLVENRGELCLFGNVPHSRWNSGFLPHVHVTHMEIVLAEGMSEEELRAR